MKEKYLQFVFRYFHIVEPEIVVWQNKEWWIIIIKKKKNKATLYVIWKNCNLHVAYYNIIRSYKNVIFMTNAAHPPKKKTYIFANFSYTFLQFSFFWVMLSNYLLEKKNALNFNLRFFCSLLFHPFFLLLVPTYNPIRFVLYENFISILIGFQGWC